MLTGSKSGDARGGEVLLEGLEGVTGQADESLKLLVTEVREERKSGRLRMLPLALLCRLCRARPSRRRRFMSADACAANSGRVSPFRVCGAQAEQNSVQPWCRRIFCVDKNRSRSSRKKLPRLSTAVPPSHSSGLSSSSSAPSLRSISMSSQTACSTLTLSV